ncbi:MAG: hypothetical protein C4296_07795 [Gemmataceae bacterium]
MGSKAGHLVGNLGGLAFASGLLTVVVLASDADWKVSCLWVLASVWPPVLCAALVTRVASKSVQPAGMPLVHLAATGVRLFGTLLLAGGLGWAAGVLDSVAYWVCVTLLYLLCLIWEIGYLATSAPGWATGSEAGPKRSP